MSDPNFPGQMDDDDLPDVPERPEPKEDYSPSPLDADDVKVTKGNRGAYIVASLIFVLAGVVGVLWYMNKQSEVKWQNELKHALSLPDGEFEPALRKILEHCDRKEILSQAALELGEAKDVQAVPLLVRAVSQGGEVGIEAAKALAKIGGDEAKLGVNDIYAQMTKSDEFAKAVYAWALCMLGDERGFSPLLEAVGKRVITPRSLPDFNADVIVRMGTTERLFEMAKNPDAMLRMYAAMELGFRTDKDPVPPLLELLKDKNDEVARAAAISLGRTTDERAGPALLAAMERSDALRSAIVSAVTQSVGAPGLEAIYKNTKNPTYKYEIVGKLKSLRDPRSKDLLLSIVNEPIPTTGDPNPAADKEREQGDNIRNQSLWTLEDLGDPRIAPMMVEKTQWEEKTAEQIPDDAVRYRTNDMQRKIANAVVSWFGKVRPEGASDDLMKIYEANQPYSNTPECAQKVKVDIGPLLDAIGRTGDKRFCKLTRPFLDQDEKFYFQSAAMAYGRLGCDDGAREFIKRLQMTATERKESKFATLLESRDWQMEDRLQERRNSVIALRFLRAKEASAALLALVLDTKDDAELRTEAGISYAYCADDAGLEIGLQKIADESVDMHARVSLASGLRFHPTPAVQNAMLALLEGQGNPQIAKAAAMALGAAANPENDARVAKLLESPDEQRQRAAVLITLLGGNPETAPKIVPFFKGEENKLVIKEWFEDYQAEITRENFENKSLMRRLAVTRALLEATAGSDDELIWPWKQVLQTLKSGSEDLPGGLTAREVREFLAEAVRTDDTYRILAGRALAGLGERGYLLALQSEKGPQALAARNELTELNSQSN
ncbi:MAG: HEAT repeat domain-containing protein [Myxococcota bacterium]|nr:HEAT repeat domain-containing protein [Myxococcota bacterium]